MRKPPPVERVEALGLACPPELGALAHVLAGERGRARVGTTVASLAPWIASALPPGVPLFVLGEVLLDDPDVHRTESLEAEAPFDFLVADREIEVAGLLVPGGLALVAASPSGDPGLLVVELGERLVLALRTL